MKCITTLSIVAVLIVIAGIAVRFNSSTKTASFDIGSYHQNVAIKDSLKAITNYDVNMIKDIIVDSVKKFDSDAISKLKSKVTTVTKEGNDTAETLTATEEVKNNTAFILWVKVIFSGIFCLAALFVVLSKKYDDETKKWAFSVLTLIAGVWIGTATK